MLARAFAGLLLFVLPFHAVEATDAWAVTYGVPVEGQTIPDEAFKYLDADSACQAEVAYPAPQGCWHTNPTNMRNYGGPQVQSGCVYDATDVCGTPYTSIYPTNMNTWKRAKTCPAGTTLHLGECRTDTPKGCNDCDLAKGNPANVGSGNKYQVERIYAAAAGGLALVLTYNSQLSNPYFRSGPFGKHWSSRYTARIRNSFQGIIAVRRGNGNELEFREPPSGTVYVTDADVNDRLERLNNGSGALIGWRYTVAEGDEVEEYNADGVLLTIRDRAGREQTLTYSNGLLTTVTDHFGRQLTFTHNAQKRVSSMTDPANGRYVQSDPIGLRGGFDSACLACFRRCQGTGQWPDSVTSGLWGQLEVSCEYWLKRIPR